MDGVTAAAGRIGVQRAAAAAKTPRLHELLDLGFHLRDVRTHDG